MYLVNIDTSKYRPHRASKKNWEPGTLNCQMEALGKYQATHDTLEGVQWSLELFLNGVIHMPSDADKCEAWIEAQKIRYYDKYCEFERTMLPECPEFHQGYYSIGTALRRLEKDGYLRVPFSAAYDSRQYDRHMDGCYMEITNIVE